MLTDVMTAVKSMLETVPAATFPVPWNNFPDGFDTVMGMVPDLSKEVLTVPKLVIVPDTAGDALRLQDEDADRCGGKVSYGVLVGLLKKHETRDPLKYDTADWTETAAWLELVESIGTYLASHEPTGVALSKQPELVFLAESDKYQQRVFSSWWRIMYG